MSSLTKYSSSKEVVEKEQLTPKWFFNNLVLYLWENPQPFGIDVDLVNKEIKTRTSKVVFQDEESKKLFYMLLQQLGKMILDSKKWRNSIPPETDIFNITKMMGYRVRLDERSKRMVKITFGVGKVDTV